MAENKTKPTAITAADYIAAVPDPVRRGDAETLSAMMARLTGHEARMWGPSIIGYGSYHYKYESGHEGEMCRIGFSPRKAELVLYILNAYGEQSEALARLGRHKTGKGCLYIRKLADVDMGALEELIRDKIARMDAAYPA